MKEVINIGNESFLLSETQSGYEFREFKNGNIGQIHEICNYGELNETIWRMIDRMCPVMV